MFEQRKENLLLKVENYKKDLRNILSKAVNIAEKEEKLIEVYVTYFNQLIEDSNKYEKTDKEYAKDLIEYAEYRFDLIKSLEDSEIDRFIVISMGLETGDTVAKDGKFIFEY